MISMSSMILQSNLRSLQILFENYVEKFGSMEGAQVARATEKIGFAMEKQGKPSKILVYILKTSKSLAMTPIVRSRRNFDQVLINIKSTATFLD